MNLREAMKTVVRDGLKDNQGGISYAIPEDKIESLVDAITNNDYFLIDFTESLERKISNYLDCHPEELEN